MNTISKETKVKIEALYYGQKILLLSGIPDNLYTVRATGRQGQSLLVTPLSLISDEDAREAYNMLRMSADFDCITAHDLKESIVAGGFMEILMRDDYGNIIEIIDFLRSKGYALPCMGYTVEQLVEAGIFTLKTP